MIFDIITHLHHYQLTNPISAHLVATQRFVLILQFYDLDQAITNKSLSTNFSKFSLPLIYRSPRQVDVQVHHQMTTERMDLEIVKATAAAVVRLLLLMDLPNLC